MTTFTRGSLLHRPGLARNRWSQLLTLVAALFTTIAVLPLVLVLAYVLIKGGSLLSVGLLTGLPPAPGL
jgi:phosphate transport system permease protein